jgi:GNAT superfamily N-acetyltransferase
MLLMTETTFLEPDAPAEQLMQALVQNMRERIVRCTEGVGEVHQRDGLTWVYTMGEGGDSAIAFPEIAPERAEEQLETLVRFYRQRHPLRQVIYWSLDPPSPIDLEARLMAYGFEENWNPHWMTLNFRNLPASSTGPEGLHIKISQQMLVWDVQDLPYYNSSLAHYRHVQALPDQPLTWHFTAWLDNQPVGQCVLSLTTGALGVAGLYDVGVVPAAREQGIGKALSLAACQFARRMGCHHAILNATDAGEHVYRRLGFVSRGYGRTWLLSITTLAAPEPSPRQRALAEALGRGDLTTLTSFTNTLTADELNLSLPGNHTLLQICAHLKQEQAAHWLLAHGAIPDVITAWDLGWKDYLRTMLTQKPELANSKRGNWQLTPLHIAVERNDLELARVLLASRPDLTLTDNQFQATATGWAHHLKRIEMQHLLEQYQ